MSSKANKANHATISAHDSWARVRLGDICEIVRGVTYKKDQAGEQPAKGMLPILRATNIQDNALVLASDLVYVPTDVVSEEQLLRAGDIVVATSSGSKHLVGKTAQVKESWAGSFGAFCAVLRPKTEINHRYLGYFFGSHEYKDYIRKKALGVNINNLRRGDLEEIAVPIAPLEQQKHIVAEIEKQFSRLDEAVANLKRVKANLKRYKATVLKAAVEGRLVETEAELVRREGRSYETGTELLQRILESRRSQWKGKGKYKEPAAPDTTDLPELPEGWTWCGLEQVSVADRYALKAGPFGSALKKEFYVESGYKIYGQEQVIRGDSTYGDYFIDEAKYRELESCAVSPGDLLISLVGTAGKVLVLPHNAMPGIINPRLLKLSLNHSHIAPEFAAYMLQSSWAGHFFKLQAHGGTMEILNLGIIKALPVPMPPLSEQLRIVDEVDRRLSLVREVDNQIDDNLKRAERLRQSILSNAFSGNMK